MKLFFRFTHLDVTGFECESEQYCKIRPDAKWSFNGLLF